jgi:hypothetical protein
VVAYTVIPSTQKAEMGGSWFKASQGKKVRETPYLNQQAGHWCGKWLQSQPWGDIVRIAVPRRPRPKYETLPEK